MRKYPFFKDQKAPKINTYYHSGRGEPIKILYHSRIGSDLPEIKEQVFYPERIEWNTDWDFDKLYVVVKEGRASIYSDDSVLVVTIPGYHSQEYNLKKLLTELKIEPNIDEGYPKIAVKKIVDHLISTLQFPHPVQTI